MTQKYKEGTLKDLQLGKKIKLKSYQKEHIEKQAADYVREQPDDWEWKGKPKEYWLDYFEKNTPKVKKWSDYCIYLINQQTTDWIRKNWQQKTETSIKHWSQTGSAVNENIRDAALILANTKNLYFSEYKMTWDKGIFWDQVGLTEITRKPIIKFFIYPEDSVENQARHYIENLIKAIKEDNGDKEAALQEILDNKTLRALMFGENGTMDNITELPKSLEYNQMPWCAQEDLLNIPSGNDARIIVSGSKTKHRIPKRVRDSISEEDMLIALENGARRYFHDDVRASANWKRVVITVLRNDNSMTYMGFSPSAEQMQIRAEGLAAFAVNKEEREKAMDKFNKLKAKAEKEQAKEEQE